MARALGLGFFSISLGYSTARRKKPHGQRREQECGFSTAGGMWGGEPGYASVPRSQALQRLRGGRGEEEWDTEAQHPSLLGKHCCCCGCRRVGVRATTGGEVVAWAPPPRLLLALNIPCGRETKIRLEGSRRGVMEAGSPSPEVTFGRRCSAVLVSRGTCMFSPRASTNYLPLLSPLQTPERISLLLLYLP